MVDFSSLKILKAILKENNFFIQILSCETVDIFESWLTSQKISYNLSFLSTYKDTNKLNLIIDDEPGKFYSDGRIILYGNRFRKETVQIVFRPTNKEICEYLHISIESAEKYSEHHNITEIRNILYPQQRLLNVYNYRMHSTHINRRDVLILAYCAMHKYVDVVYENLKYYDGSFENKFLVDCSLNLLISNRYIRVGKKKIEILCSEDYIILLCNAHNIKYN